MHVRRCRKIDGMGTTTIVWIAWSRSITPWVVEFTFYCMILEVCMISHQSWFLLSESFLSVCFKTYETSSVFGNKTIFQSNHHAKPSWSSPWGQSFASYCSRSWNWSLDCDENQRNSVQVFVLCSVTSQIGLSSSMIALRPKIWTEKSGHQSCFTCQDIPCLIVIQSHRLEGVAASDQWHFTSSRWAFASALTIRFCYDNLTEGVWMAAADQLARPLALPTPEMHSLVVSETCCPKSNLRNVKLCDRPIGAYMTTVRHQSEFANDIAVLMDLILFSCTVQGAFYGCTIWTTLWTLSFQHIPRTSHQHWISYSCWVQESETDRDWRLWQGLDQRSENMTGSSISTTRQVDGDSTLVQKGSVISLDWETTILTATRQRETGIRPTLQNNWNGTLLTNDLFGNCRLYRFGVINSAFHTE
jgi:hypothetical protein